MNVPTDRNGNPSVTTAMKRQCHGEYFVDVSVECPECDGMGCDACGLEGCTDVKIDIPWDTVKRIYKDMANVAAEEDLEGS